MQTWIDIGDGLILRGVYFKQSVGVRAYDVIVDFREYQELLFGSRSLLHFLVYGFASLAAVDNLNFP